MDENWTIYSLSYIPQPDYGPVVNDQGTGIDAWSVTGTGYEYGWYLHTLTSTEIARAESEGWHLRVEARALSTYDQSSHGVIFRPRPNVGWQFLLGTDGEDLIVRVADEAVPNAAQYHRIPGAAEGYHLYDFISNSTDGTANLYVDGALLVAGVSGQISHSNTGWIGWGDLSGGGSGNSTEYTVHFAKVQFSVGGPPPGEGCGD